MADPTTEPTLHKFTYKELVSLMIEKRGITEGLWGIYVKFGIAGANLGPTPELVVPAAVVPVLEIGLQEFAEAGPLSVDASTLRPGAPAQPSKSSGKTSSTP
jgi:hypothetical protein